MSRSQSLNMIKIHQHRSIGCGNQAVITIISDQRILTRGRIAGRGFFIWKIQCDTRLLLRPANRNAAEKSRRNPPQECPFPWGIRTPSKTQFIGPTRVHISNSISIGSAVFAQLTTESRYTSQRAAPFPH